MSDMFAVWRNLSSGDLGTWMIQIFLIPVSLFYANAFEWTVHRYILHGLGKRRNSIWSFHWAEHHRSARQNNFMDPAYRNSLFILNSQSKEVIALVFAAVCHAPLITINQTKP